jgi:hypothetical protein
MRSLVRVTSALAVYVALASCASSTGPQTLADRLTGTWSENGLGQFGTGFTMVLAAHDTIVTGTGNYQIEAGRSGTVTVAGVIEAPNIHLDITYDYGDVAHFNATLQPGNTLGGAWYTTSDPVPVSFRKVAQ